MCCCQLHFVLVSQLLLSQGGGVASKDGDFEREADLPPSKGRAHCQVIIEILEQVDLIEIFALPIIILATRIIVIVIFTGSGRLS